MSKFSNSNHQMLSEQILTIPSSSVPQWSSVFTIDIKDKGYIINNLCLNFNISAIRGLTGTVTNYPAFTPASFFFKTIEILIGGRSIEIIYPSSNWLRSQLFHNDIERSYINSSQGNYNSLSARNTLSTKTSDYYCDLESYFSQSLMHLIHNSPDIQLRVTMAKCEDVVSQSTLTGTPSATLNYCNLLINVNQATNQMNTQTQLMLKRGPFEYQYHYTLYQSPSLTSGSSSYTTILSNIVGDIAGLIVIIRPLTGLVDDGQWNSFQQKSSMHLLNSSGSSLMGGAPINDIFLRNVLGKKWSASTYLSESTPEYVYVWSFSSDLVKAIQTGDELGSYPMCGNERLVLNFSSNLSANSQIDIIAFQEASMIVKYNGQVEKVTN